MHIAMMIDLETLGLENSTLILSAGIVIGDLDSNEDRRGLFEQEFFLTPTSQKGRTVSVDTLDWWMKQIAEGAQFPVAEGRVPLQEFLAKLQDFTVNNKVNSVWSKGADFDIQILEHAFRQSNMTIPWTYRQPRCYRTVEALFNSDVPEYVKARNVDEKAHGGLGDARYQYRMLHHYWDFIAQGR